MSITKEKKNSIIKDFRVHDCDTGSSEVQIAILTERIKNLTAHLQVHKKDVHSRLGLLKIISKRRKLIDYLSNVNSDSYSAIIKRLNIRK